MNAKEKARRIYDNYDTFLMNSDDVLASSLIAVSMIKYHTANTQQSNSYWEDVARELKNIQKEDEQDL